MKLLKYFILAVTIFLLVGCQESNTNSQNRVYIEGLNDIELIVGDEIPNYLNNVKAFNANGDEVTDIIVNDDEVDYDLEGRYPVYYIATDIDGTSVMSSINVSIEEPYRETDYSSPYFEGVQNFDYYIGEDIILYKDIIKAFDEVDGNLTDDIIYDGEVDFASEGTYEITITVYDQTGNRKIETFEINVFSNQKPMILNNHRIYYVIGNEAPNYTFNIKAYDQEDGDLTDSVVVNDQEVDLTKEGIYPLYYEIEDSYGHKVTEVESVQVSANDKTMDIDQLDVYYINDTHGSILEFEEEMGLAKIGNVVIDAYEKNPYETLFLSGGDLLQGNVLSNFYYGSSMIDMFNYMHLDVFVLGNHEFDWGVERITEYFNPETLGMKAEFPLLAANMFYKGTEERPDFVDAYSIIEKGDLKIGIVGTIGSGLESSIAKSRVEDYEFKSPTYWTEYYTKLLREDFDVDVVYAISHGNDDYFNTEMSINSGSYQIDGIFNGHTHSAYADLLNGVPLLQSSSNARALGHLNYTINNENQAEIQTYKNLYESDDLRLQLEHEGLKNLIDGYVEEIYPLLNEAILYSSRSYDRSILTTFMAEVIRDSADADAGVHNSGGTRDSLSYGQAITVGTTYKIFPFDNQIISVKMTGRMLLNLVNNSSVEVSLKEGLSEGDIDLSADYWVATNDYVFGNYDEFEKYSDIYYPNIVDREAFENELRERAETTDQFIIN